MGGGRRGEAPVSRELGGLEFAHCSASCTIQVGSGSGVISNCAHPERMQAPSGVPDTWDHFLPSGQLRGIMIQLPVPGAAASLGGGGICVCVHICAHMWERRELDVSVFPNHSPPHFFQSLTNLEFADEPDSLANDLSGSVHVVSSSRVTDEHRHAWLLHGLWRTLHKSLATCCLSLWP